MIEPQITYRGMEHSAVLDTHIRELVAKMEQFHPKITRIHVIVDELDRNKRNGNLFNVRVDVHVPGQEIVATKQEHEDAYVAMNDAFDVLTRQLEENIRKVRGEVKRHNAERGDNAAP